MGSPLHGRHLLALTAFFALVWLEGTPVCGAASATDAAFVQGLQERKLFRLVDQFCEQRLADKELNDTAKVDVAVAWLRAASARALEATPQQQAEAWEQFADVVAACRAIEEAPRGLLVNVQIALATLTRAEVVTYQATSRGSTDELATARELVRTALGKLQSFRRQIEGELQAARQRRGAQDGDWKVAELDALGRNLVLQLAKAYRTQALCYPEGSPDYVNALGLAVESLQSLPVVTEGDPTLWRARVEHITCLRLLGQIAEARRHVEHWRTEEPPAPVAARLTAEELHLDLAEGKAATALATARELLATRSADSTVPETDDAILRVLLAARAEAESADAAELTEQAAAQVRHIAGVHGPYWKRRAESSLGQSLAGTTDTSDPTLLVHAAESLYRAGNFAEALATYDRAAEQFHSAQQHEQSFTAARTAAAIARETDGTAEAAQRFRRLALEHREHSEAAEAHRTAIGLVAELSRNASGTDRAGILEKYDSLLEEHLAIWSHASSADTVRWWLGQRLSSGRRWMEAAEVLTGTSASSGHFEEAITLAAECYQNELRNLSEGEPKANSARHTLAQQATAQLQPIITGKDNRWPEEWTDLQRTIALHLADVQLRYAEGGTDYAEKLLQVALRDTSHSDAAWVAQSTSLLALAKLRSGNFEAAIERLTNTSFPNAAAIADSLPRLIETLEAKSAAHNPQYSALVDALHRWQQSAHRFPDATDSKVLQSLDLSAARLALLRGDSSAAKPIFRRLLAADATEGDLFEQVATLLARSHEQDDLRESLRIWQQVEQRSQPAGERWTRARKARIELLERVGDEEQADKLRRVTALLYPQLGSSGR